ncbi:MAG: hypothetical protein DWQ05_23130 [Calditrichaeota bacterium]|nr:MAG: hypothetical protein DWQ05_23130 [Calditrichota bacterium]
MKKIAIPVFGDRISNRLDCCENILLISIEDGVIKTRDAFRLTHLNPAVKLAMLVELGIDVLICNGITEFYTRRLSDCNVQVIPWIYGEVDNVLACYLNGMIKINGSGGINRNQKCKKLNGDNDS